MSSQPLGRRATDLHEMPSPGSGDESKVDRREVCSPRESPGLQVLRAGFESGFSLQVSL